MFHLSPRDPSTVSKDITICLDYPRFSCRIELWLVTAATDSIQRLTRFPEAKYELWLILSCGLLEFRQLDTICGCLEAWRLDSSYDWVEFRWLSTSYSCLHPTTDSSSGSWIRVAADSILRLDSSCSWLRPTANLSSGSWIRVTADSILCLTRVPATRYDLQLIRNYELWLILFCGWLEFLRLDSKCGWLIL